MLISSCEYVALDFQVFILALWLGFDNFSVCQGVTPVPVEMQG